MSNVIRNHNHLLGSLAVASLLLSGCAAATGSAEEPSAQHSGQHSATSAAPIEPTDGPSEAAKMVCGQETQDNVSEILELKAAPHSVSSWADKTFTCTYHLAEGPLVISVKESADPASALKYFGALAVKIGGAAPIKGLANLGFPAYQTDGGSVVFLKDNNTLYVDATKLPAAVGPHGVTPTAFAYQVSTTILACWKEHH
jgi:hypothetical protein